MKASNQYLPEAQFSIQNSEFSIQRAEAVEVRKLQKQVLDFVKARANAMLHSNMNMSECQIQAIASLETLFSFNQYTRLESFARAVVGQQKNFERIMPSARSRFYQKEQHLRILALKEKCSQLVNYA